MSDDSLPSILPAPPRRSFKKNHSYMNKLILSGLSAILLIGASASAQAKDKDKDKYKYDKHDHHDDHRYDKHRPPVVVVDRTRVVWVIENGRPVKRVVYVNSRGKYYRRVGGRQVFVTQRYFSSYPSKYYYQDGRRRPGITINF